MKNRLLLFLAGIAAVLCIGAASIPYVLINESRNVALNGSSNYVANLYGSGANLTGIPSVNGTSNYLAKFSGTNVLTNSVIYESGGHVGIGTTTLTAADLVVNGTFGFGAGLFSLAGDTLPAWGGGFEINNEAGVGPHIRGYSIRFDTGASTGSPAHPTYTGMFDLGSDGNIGMTGNLTVSGTGNSSVAGNFGIGTNTPTAAKLVVVGGGYFYGDVSCSNIVDLSDSPATLSDAVAIVTSIETTNGKVDHAKLSPLAWGKTEVGNGVFTTNKTSTVTAAKTNIVTQVIPAGVGYDAITNLVEVVTPAKTNVISQIVEGKVAVPDQSKRNLSMVVSAQSLTIKDLLTRIEKLETTIKDFETRIGKLEVPK